MPARVWAEGERRGAPARYAVAQSRSPALGDIIGALRADGGDDLLGVDPLQIARPRLWVPVRPGPLREWFALLNGVRTGAWPTLIWESRRADLRRF
jgi:hypothetical protein